MATATESLIQTNIRWLRQALALLDRVPDYAYAASPKGFEPHRAGGHLRHILEFYQCFVEGAATLHIDYDARRRDRNIETSRAAAAATIRSLIGTLETSSDLRIDATVWVREEDGDQFLESSLNRELQVLSSHTIHHFALLALTLRLHGVEMDPDFGMAPSTLRYQRTLAAEAA
jgi:DinB superfamily